MGILKIGWGSRECRNSGPACRPARREGTPLPGQPSPAVIRHPLRLGKPRRQFPPAARQSLTLTLQPRTTRLREASWRRGCRRSPAPLGSRRSGWLQGNRDQYPGASSDPETLCPEVTSPGGWPKGRVDRGCALAPGSHRCPRPAETIRQRRTKRRAEERGRKPRNRALEPNEPSPRLRLGPRSKQTGRDASHLGFGWWLAGLSWKPLRSRDLRAVSAENANPDSTSRTYHLSR
ncbi:uncharacterized protein LOC144582499 [Callithrix jacchus]